MAAGDGEHPIREIIPGIAVPEGTGAPGNQGITAAAPAGPQIGTATVTPPYGQARDATLVPVYNGDSAGSADDVPAHVSPLTPGPLDGYQSTGAGRGDGTSKITRYPWQAPNRPRS
jgi:hypothetical protein